VLESPIRSTVSLPITGEIRLEHPGTRRFGVEFTPDGRPAPGPSSITVQVK
jgi:hypothetical protein